MAETQKHFATAAQQFGNAVHMIKPDQWSDSTPCTEWDVRALVKHLVYECVWVPPIFEGKTIAEVGDQFEGDILGDDPAAAYDAAAAGATEAVSAGGAMDITAHLSFGDFPGSEYATQVLFDLLIHGWDLRTAIGADATMDASLIDFVMPWAEVTMDSYRKAGAVGPMPAIPDDASPQTRLLALTGREG